MSEEPSLRNEVIDDATKRIHEVFLNIDKRLREENRRTISVDETDIALERIKHFTSEARIVDLIEKLSAGNSDVRAYG